MVLCAVCHQPADAVANDETAAFPGRHYLLTAGLARERGTRPSRLPELGDFKHKTSYLPVATPSNADGKMEVAAQGDADETVGQGFSKLGARGSDGQP